ncbi:hypothetical protein [Lacrimispora sp. 210928-DFI.3.58]|uniref:hypothetical protein n=1 Tax=Lacrimispora sp. 210928-DFI.3.58 TaxID=2883214 RepID=UPI001D090DEA|nr:hypothetical protein [Lacrimispora sp. 210928-DFI.3.58]MCB7321307.1 hypothetical protein [Lacrimispora sp. 210928-DFI.3.58]
MLSNIERNIIIRALKKRRLEGENPAEILTRYTRLTNEEKAEILAALEGGT